MQFAPRPLAGTQSSPSPENLYHAYSARAR
jgi:hypothetical protein